MHVYKRKIKSIGFVILLIVVLVLMVAVPLLLKLLTHAGSVQPEGLTIGNVSPSSITLAWVTSESADGRVLWGTTDTLDMTVEDLRKELASSWNGGYSHIVRLTDIPSGSTIYFRVMTNGKLYPDKDSEPLSFKTPDVSEQQLTSPLKLFGDVSVSNVDYIVVVSPQDKSVYPFIAAVTSDGTWYSDISSSYDKSSLSAVTFSPSDKFNVMALGKDGGAQNNVSSDSSPISIQIDPQMSIVDLISGISNVNAPRVTGVVNTTSTTTVMNTSTPTNTSIPTSSTTLVPTNSITEAPLQTSTPIDTITPTDVQSTNTPTITPQSTPIDVPDNVKLKYLNPNDLKQDVPLNISSGLNFIDNLLPTPDNGNNLTPTPGESNVVEPSYPLVGNISESATTIVWRTKTLDATSFTYGDDNNTEEVKDSRGDGPFYFHVVDLKYLTPGMTYNYVAKTTDNDLTGSFTIPQTLSSPPMLLNISGIVKGTSKECLLVTQLQEGDKQSDYGIVVTAPEKAWSLDIGSLRLEDKSDYFSPQDTTDMLIDAYCVDQYGLMQAGELNVKVGDAKDTQIVINIQ